MNERMKPFEELDVIDNYLATAAASDPVIGKNFARTLVEGLLQIELKDNIHVNIERAILGVTPQKRGIRMDIEVSEYELDELDAFPLNVYDLEPNKRQDINIVKHNRFYQAKIDSENLKSGERDFIKLPNLFVIMITNYDPFGYDYMLYTVRNRCDEIPELEYEDGLHFLYFNTTGTKGGNVELKRFLTYIQDSQQMNATDDVTQKLHDMVGIVKESQKVRMAYMMWEEMIFYERKEAKEEGREEGALSILVALVKEGVLSTDEAAKRTNMTVEAFQKELNV